MFGAAIFLTAMAAIGVPVAIHYLAQQRTRVLPWGAMAFLQQSISSASSRRNRLRDLLLLLLRGLAIICLVLTFAQPLTSRLWLGGSDLETVFIWDVSLSTTAVGATGQPVIDSMKQALLTEMSRLPSTSHVKILLAGAELRWLRDEPLVLSETNRRSLETSIRQQQADHGGSELATAILTALSGTEAESSKTRNLVVLHDGRRQGWQATDSTRWQAIHQRLAATPRLSICSLAASDAIEGNSPQLSVSNLESDRETIALDSAVRFRVTLKNHSTTTPVTATVIWRIGQREVERSNAVSIPAGLELKLEQLLSFGESGCQQVECEAQLPGDILPADNTLTTVVSVPAGIPVLLVDDTARTQQGQILPSEFLAAAFGSPLEVATKTPDKMPIQRKHSLFSPQVVKSRDLTPASLTGNLAVVIANAVSLPPAAVVALRSFVEKGGGLWIMMAADWQKPPAWHSDLLKELGLESLATSQRTLAKDPDQRMKIIASDPSSAFAEGIAARRLDLHRAELLAVHELNQRAYLDDEKRLETEQGSPVLLTLAVGAGRVILQTSDLSRLNTNLPILQSFVPLVREEMMEAVEGALPKHNLNPGEPIRLPLAAGGSAGDQLRIKRPDGSTRDMALLGTAHESSETMNPGIYQIEQPNQTSSQDRPELFSVRRPTSESVLDAISLLETTALIQASASSPQVAAAEVHRGLWPLAWFFALLTGVFFAAEALLAHWIARQREVETVTIELKPIF
jgi:Aerotolerance regulator N-terminal/von Willebrand factor type A domain